MTREEAIMFLIDLKDETISRYKREAIDMAIVALDREKRALSIHSKVKNIDGWENIVNEVARLDAEERGKVE